MDFINNCESDFKKVLDDVKNEKRLGVHSFHRYYGKLIPAIPRAAIRKFTQEGDIVFDPFVGSGTTAVETLYAERNFVGVEINPLSVMISNIKTSNYDLEVLKKLEDNILDLVEKDESPVTDEEKPFCVNNTSATILNGDSSNIDLYKDKCTSLVTQFFVLKRITTHIKMRGITTGVIIRHSPRRAL